MRLNYDKGIPSDPSALVLSHKDGSRVEIHLRKEENGTTTLLAFAGRDASQPERASHQGPYELQDQAIAARRAIATHLQQSGFRVDPDRHAIWSIAVQRSIKAIRERKQAFTGSYAFDPKDVFLDW